MTPFKSEILPVEGGYALQAGRRGIYATPVLSSWFLDDDVLTPDSYEEIRGVMAALRIIRAKLRLEGRESGVTPILTSRMSRYGYLLDHQGERYCLPDQYNDASLIDGILSAMVPIEARLADKMAELEVRAQLA